LERFKCEKGLQGVVAGRSIVKEDVKMLEVTQAATQQIAEYFKGKKVQPIRIFLNEGG
jgi:hypothetical protein